MNIRKDILTIVLIGILVFLISIILGIIINKQLEGPELCSSCHEMLPYYNSYISPANGSIISSHKLNCVQCHASKSLEEARKNIAAEIIVYTLNISLPAILPDELKPDCIRCHVPATPVHRNLNQTNCSDCHFAHTLEGKNSNLSLRTTIPYGPHKNKTCRDCHGTAFEIPQCIKCHSGHGGQKLENGLCIDCHTDPHVPVKPGILRNNTVNFTIKMPLSACRPCHEKEFLDLTNFPSGHNDMETCTSCHEFHGEKPRCSKCHPGMMLDRHPQSFRCNTCHATFEGGIRITCQDCHGRSHEWSAFSAVINPK